MSGLFKPLSFKDLRMFLMAAAAFSLASMSVHASNRSDGREEDLKLILQNLGLTVEEVSKGILTGSNLRFSREAQIETVTEDLNCLLHEESCRDNPAVRVGRAERIIKFVKPIISSPNASSLSRAAALEIFQFANLTLLTEVTR